MAIQIVPAPGRQFKTYSMILGILIGSLPALALMIESMRQTELVSKEAALWILSVLGFLIVPAKLIHQSISATAEQKADIIAAAASQPLKSGEPAIETKINETPIPSTPQKDKAP